MGNFHSKTAYRESYFSQQREAVGAPGASTSVLPSPCSVAPPGPGSAGCHGVPRPCQDSRVLSRFLNPMESVEVRCLPPEVACACAGGITKMPFAVAALPVYKVSCFLPYEVIGVR